MTSHKWPAAVCIALAGALMSGCHASDGGTPAPSAADAAVSKAKAIQQMRDNPNIPPETKAGVIAQIQSNGAPAAKP